MAAPIASGDVKFTYRHFWLGNPRALWAAEAAECAADQGKFWAMHDFLMRNQKQWTRVQLEDAAKTVGLDAPKFKQCFDANTHTQKIKDSTAEAQKLGLTGTPSFFVNGKAYSDLTYIIEKNGMAQIVQQELKK